ncbi:polysaccharide biosynthesis/export family protein [Pinisolibacter sp.]|uniref:polysaccharide biosynthesis/export family protein n=1 Tax=Pinisolibacter sp. TaxID=2172024 RepID=UPI002FDE9CFD
MNRWFFVAPSALALALALAGCSAMPTSGPSTDAIVSARQSDQLPDGLELFDIDATVARIVEAYRTLPLSGRFADKRPTPSQTIGIGDAVGIAIFEAGAGGLFSTSNGQLGGGSKHVGLPPQDVGADGTVSVPYAGRIPVAGRTTAQVEKEIVDRLRDKAIEPQAVVTLHARRSGLVSVNGDVGGPGRFPLSPRGDRIMDVVSMAGGTKGVPNELFIRLTRHGSTGSVPVRTILEDPAQNIWAWPGDEIFVYREPQRFTAIGATGRSGNFEIEYERTSLIEAIGAAAGLHDDRAEPAGIFVYRQERADLVCALKGEKPCAAPDRPRPIVYRLNLRQPEGFALAQRIPLRNKDVVYVANADGTELLKFIRLMQATTGVVASTANQTSSTVTRIKNW